MRLSIGVLNLLLLFAALTPSLSAHPSVRMQRLVPAPVTEPIEESEPVRARPGPLVVVAPGEVEISIQITPTEDTTELLVYADSGSFYRSSTIPLDGVDSDPFHTLRWRGFPVGTYEVVGMLVGGDGSSEVVVRGALRVVDRRVNPF